MNTFVINPKNSIARRIGLYFFIIIGFATLISGISLGIMWSNKSDASLINVSGSLRYQSYRFWHEMNHAPENIELRLEEYRASLNSPELQALNSSYLLPKEVKARYQRLKDVWEEMALYIRHQDHESYLSRIEHYVKEIDAFVSALQKFAEFKLKIAISVIAISMLLIIALAYYGIWYTRKRIIKHLDQLVLASQQIQQEDFDHVNLAINEQNELGVLSKTFTQMASELKKLYTSLEDKVADKTRRLTAVNRSMMVLYQCSQILTSKPVNRDLLLQVLERVLANEQLKGIALDVYGADYWNITLDTDLLSDQWQKYEIAIENEKIAMLRWKSSLLCPDERLLHSVAEMIGRSIYVVQNHKQQQQLILMEERSIIARELHDSLAQSLTFFKIQIRLLQRNGETEQDWEKQKNILNDLEKALNDAYSQLRELLSTFRLTIDEANLTSALERMLDTLRARTSAQIRLTCKLPSLMFSAQEQVHVLQIIREAVINAIKHAEASEIEVIAETNADGEHCLMILDNGKGIETDIEPEGHYGLTIMKERATELHGEFKIQNRPEGGALVMVILPNMLSKR
ncbi:nitrate/nitrite sensor protein NarQ [Actinobacillus minor 202]|uniref:Sensor protein n=1 Tax=Actinobacillus minor 202 TaxID=591023 RepID=A0ABM9YT05_9PAST|nr:nitrate/nitrite two-component system sensor histidine kinase NarQ [Actinobacillus minor]EEV24438.1 nitrate/nitrite sensor protein NarQ [Actinobacillus minor 202]